MNEPCDTILNKAHARIADHYRIAESDLLPLLRAALEDDQYRFDNTQRIATHFLETLKRSSSDWLSTFLNEYKLSNAEGLALLTLSEALLRVPDSATANQLLRDKLGSGDWDVHRGRADSWLINSATLGLSVARSLLDDKQGVLHTLVNRLGEPVVRNVAIAATKLLANHFILGENIDDAIRRAQKEHLLCSFDMLGEAARTRQDSDRYFDAYVHAIKQVGSTGTLALPHAISIKLSALYPRYEPLHARHAVPAIVEKLHSLAQLAARYQLQLTIDAEECERLEMSLQIFERVMRATAPEWQGLGLAVQAYQKRALPVLQWLHELANEIKRPVVVRLVKGAYWDTEIKRCQQSGLTDYPVFTHKSATDVSYLACARFMLDSEWIRCAFATHNAMTVAQILNWNETSSSQKQLIEFQRLQGMGTELYDLVNNEYELPCRVYAPVGGHGELLAYLVRRMLENGANSSFVQQMRRDDVDMQSLLADPKNANQQIDNSRSAIPPPSQILSPRRNSDGLDLSDRRTLDAIDQALQSAHQKTHAASVISTAATSSSTNSAITNPADATHIIGQATSINTSDVSAIVRAAHAAHAAWSNTSVEERTSCLERTANAFQTNMLPLISLLILEAGKTRADAMNEVREAIDFCRYYAVIARELMGEKTLPGPTGERNTLSLAPRGVFACISPWNFPLAIFSGQVTAALVTGNCVIAKPAPQTPLIAQRVVELLHECGVPKAVLHLLPGDAAIGEALVMHPDVAGVVFTGSTVTARRIAQTLLSNATRPLIPLIAETGGINAMIVDSTALPEQVANDVLISAFYSAGQRCSALRLLCLQEEIYAPVISMLQGAMKELRIGDPSLEDTDIGPVIDLAARQKIDRYVDEHHRDLLYRVNVDASLPGHFVVPTLLAVNKPQDVAQEVFGPVLHVMRWTAGSLETLIDDINANGYGLTMGLHTRLESTINTVKQRAKVGNLYVNRSMTGAVVGVQPFGGEGLSGTGFKAGGPHYLLRFCTERSVSIDTTAAGGNASLLSNPAT